METKESLEEKYIRAKARAAELRAFYIKALKYVIFTALLFTFKYYLIDIIEGYFGFTDLNLRRWVSWNINSVPMVLGIILAVKAFKLFVSNGNFLKEWEDRKMQEIINNDQND